MNIFIIPSWYPGKESPIGGIFIKEQAEALAELYPGHNFIVSFTENFFLSVSQVGGSIDKFKEFKGSSAYDKKLSDNLFLFYKPVVSWTEKLGGEIRNIIKGQTENFLEAEKMFGKIHLIHAHVSYPGGFAAMKLSEKFNVPFIITEHMAPFPFERYIENGKLSEKISMPLSNANKIISVSNFSACEIMSFGIKSPVVIPNAVNENVFFPIEEERKKDETEFLTVATLTERKGITELLESILLLKDSSVKCKFKIAGTGHLDDYIIDFINTNGLSEKIELIKDPSREELTGFFQNCDVFILPSRHESFGIVYVEAMACGKPVIATNCGGPADFINKDNGLLVEVGNVRQLADAIRTMILNIDKYDRKVIRDFFMNNFSRKNVCSQIVSVYEEVTGEKFEKL